MYLVFIVLVTFLVGELFGLILVIESLSLLGSLLWGILSQYFSHTDSLHPVLPPLLQDSDDRDRRPLAIHSRLSLLLPDFQ